MPIIYTYPTVTPNSDDLVLLTDTSDSQKATKTASISSLLDLGSTGIVSNKTTVSSAELLDMGSGSGFIKELIPTPGPGKAIQIVGPIYTKYNANTTLYTGAITFFYVSFIDASGANVGNAGTIDDNSVKAGWNMTWIVESGLKESWYENSYLGLYPNTSFAGGDGSIDVYVNYRIITL